MQEEVRTSLQVYESYIQLTVGTLKGRLQGFEYPHANDTPLATAHQASSTIDDSNDPEREDLCPPVNPSRFSSFQKEASRIGRVYCLNNASDALNVCF
jgi:hypothetical protein